jgi:predicted ABC-type transport system involved in lysophospholipase L1 biosynthesis ATPase subunit
LRVLDNVLIGRLPQLKGWRQWAALCRYFKGSQREMALRCLDHVGLLDRVWQRTDTLSGGEQQRVAIAKIQAQEPQVILADRPVASLDVMNGPNYPMVIRTDLPDSLKRAIQQALMTMKTKNPEAFAAGGARIGGFVRVDDATYQIIRDLNETARRLAALK